MPFIPHTTDDTRAMLSRIGVKDIEQLFSEIPAELRSRGLTATPPGINEMAITRLMHERAESDGRYLNFIGAGVYEHHIPAAVWQIATRGEFYSAYTPYQAEASQGTLQLLYEYQTMMASLTGMDVSNASLYDGASALAEAVLMAVRVHKSSRKILIPATVNPIYRKVVNAVVKNQGIEIIEVPYNAKTGNTALTSLSNYKKDEFAALVIPQPNFFGTLEEIDQLTDWAHGQEGLVIGLVNPTSLALLTAPGTWGTKGADIAVGEGQPLGIPLSNGGPYFGFMACKQALVRQMPGRIIGRTVDAENKPGFALTLQAREQHIRRSKATSNICTNQGLMVTAATIYMALLGQQGLTNVATQSHHTAQELLQTLTKIPGVKRIFTGHCFHEIVLQFEHSVSDLLASLRKQHILGGLNLKPYYPELGEALLICATETKTASDIELYAKQISNILTARSVLTA